MNDKVQVIDEYVEQERSQEEHHNARVASQKEPHLLSLFVYKKGTTRERKHLHSERLQEEGLCKGSESISGKENSATAATGSKFHKKIITQCACH